MQKYERVVTLALELYVSRELAQPSPACPVLRGWNVNEEAHSALSGIGDVKRRIWIYFWFGFRRVQQVQHLSFRFPLRRYCRTFARLSSNVASERTPLHGSIRCGSVLFFVLPS